MAICGRQLGYKMFQVLNKPIVDELVKCGMTAVYCTDANYERLVVQMDRNTVLIYSHDSGQDVILLGENGIDHVRFKFEGERMVPRVDC